MIPVFFNRSLFVFLAFFTLWACDSKDKTATEPDPGVRSASADYSEAVVFSGSRSTDGGKVYEVLPGPAVMNPAMNPTPFSDNINMTSGSYTLEVSDVDEEDSPTSADAASNVSIMFTGDDGRRYKISNINIIHKENGAGDHTFFGGVGRNKVMHGNTGIGTGLMPKMLAYITLWGLADLKDATTDSVLATNRVIHIMTATNVRDENLKMIPSTAVDSSDHNFWRAQTHIILPPQDTQGNSDPVPGTPYGFLHMMFEDVELFSSNRDQGLAYEVLPGPAVINPAMSPTPFSDRVALASGFVSLKTSDTDANDSGQSNDAIDEFTLRFERPDGTVFTIDAVQAVHKPEGSGDHTFFGGVGYDKDMHGNTGIGTGLMPRMLAYITFWGVADLKDGNGNVLDSSRPIHVMVASRARRDDLSLIGDVSTDQTDHSADKVEIHVILPPTDTAGNPDPVAGSGHGFLHLMFEKVSLQN